MKQRILESLAVVGLWLSTVATLGASDLWLHVRVDESDGAQVKVNLPITMVEKALAILPKDHLRHGRIQLDSCCHELTPAELRELWQEIQGSPDMTFVTVQEEDEEVRVWKESGYLKVSVRDRKAAESVDVRIPMRVVGALISGDEDSLNLEAAIRALAEEGEGELVTVSGKGESVRVWVDQIAEAN